MGRPPLAPTVSPTAAGCASPLDLVGNTPLLWIGAPLTPSGRGFLAKLEGHNPGGIKDRAALHLVKTARDRGDLVPGARIVESTSGTFGLGLALAGSAYGHPITLVTDPGLEPMMASMLGAYGADVTIVEEPAVPGGWQQARRDTVAGLLANDPTAWCPDQYHNPDTVDGYRRLGAELVSQTDRIDILVCSVGTGGHSAGVFGVVKAAYPRARMVGVDAVSSTIFGQPAGQRLMRGLGSSIFPTNVDYESFSEVHWVAANEAVWSARQLARRHFATGGWSVGAVALVAGWLARTEPAGTRVVAVFPDGPSRYATTVFDDSYCRAHGLFEAPPSDAPDTIEHSGSRTVDRWTRCMTVTAPRRQEVAS